MGVLTKPLILFLNSMLPGITTGVIINDFFYTYIHIIVIQSFSHSNTQQATRKHHSNSRYTIFI